METKIGQQSDIIKHTKDAIDSAEKNRKTLRFKFNLNELGTGRLQVLGNDEFVDGLVEYFVGSPSLNWDETKNILIQLGGGTLVEDIALRERSLAILSPVSGFYVEQNEREGIFILADVFYSWLEYETEFLPGFSVIIKRVEELLEWFLRNSCWNDAEKMILLLCRIQSGSLDKSAAVRSLICTTMEKIAKKNSIEKLTDDYLLDSDQRPAIKNILISFGDRSAIYQLNRVIHSHSRSERVALIDLIPAFGDLVIPVLVECLEKNPPWTVVRNIVYIISEIGADRYYPIVEQYLLHQDMRVQHEMVCCIVKVGGQAMIKRLLEAFGIVNDRLKIHIIRLLVEQATRDDDILQSLCELAKKRNTFSVNRRYELLNTLIYGLKAFPCVESLEVLEEMHAEYDKKRGTEQILLNITEALKLIKPQIRHSLHSLNVSQDVLSFESDPIQKHLAKEKTRKIEEEVANLIAAGNMPEAGQLIYAKSVAAAQVKDFAVAEMLRDRLLEINPMLLSEVVQLGELIEEEKNSSITSHHIEIWNELYEEMTTEEFNVLYYSLRQENYRKDDIIVNIGETDPHLYFLNSGHINLSCISGGKDVFLKRIQPGEVLGSEQFFSASVWTVSLKAFCEVQVQVLERQDLDKITVEYPGIVDTLRMYCRKFVQIPELLKMSGDDRREYPRYAGRLITRSTLLDPYGNKGKKSFQGELLDVSKSGLVFILRISNTNNARLLLGRQLTTVITLDGKETLQFQGVIVGVKNQDPVLQDYSVHVKLSKKISDDLFKRIVFQAGSN